jgi:malonyl-ACP O-methyltransferase BioC
MNKEIIERNFSRHAELYDKYSDIQRLAARELIKYLPSADVADILEIGCGTGAYTTCLREKFITANLEAFDISSRMLKVARRKLPDDRIRFVLCDGEKPGLNRKFGIITSNAALQWFDDIEESLIKYSNLLTEKGIIAFSIFGPLTFRELRQALNGIFAKPISMDSASFLDDVELGAIMGRYFQSVKIRELLFEKTFPSLVELLRTIKYSGIRGDGAGGAFMWKRDALKKTEEIYRMKFGDIKATYQIFLCRAVK